MASKIKVDQIEGSTGSTITIPSGQTLDASSGTITLPDSAVDLASAKVTGTIPTSKGGTGLTSLGTAGQVVQVNSGATALEFANASSGKIYDVYYNEKTAEQTISAGTYTWVDISGLSRTITPQSASSKFWIHGRVSASSDGNHQYIGLNCGGSLVHIADSSGSRFRTTSSNAAQATWDMSDQNFAYLWEPATTSAVTIKIQGTYEGSVLYINRGYRDTNALYDSRATSGMTIFELTS